MSAVLLLEMAKLETKLYLRHGLAIWWTFCFPLIWLIAVTVLVPAEALSSYGRLFVPGICTTVILSTSLMGVLDYLVDMREARVYEVMALQGVKPSVFAGAILASRGTLTMLQVLLVFLLTSRGLGSFEITFTWSRLLILLLAASFSVAVMFQLSVALTQTVRTKMAARTLATVTFYVCIFMGGLYYDMSWLPGWLQVISYVLPSYHICNLLGGALLPIHAGNYYESCCVLAVYLCLCVVYNSIALNWTHRSSH